MFLLAFHIVAVAIIVVIVWGLAHRLGRRAGERQLRRRLGLDAKAEGAPPAGAVPQRD